MGGRPRSVGSQLWGSPVPVGPIRSSVPTGHWRRLSSSTWSWRWRMARGVRHRPDPSPGRWNTPARTLRRRRTSWCGRCRCRSPTCASSSPWCRWVPPPLIPPLLPAVLSPTVPTGAGAAQYGPADRCPPHRAGDVGDSGGGWRRVRAQRAAGLRVSRYAGAAGKQGPSPPQHRSLGTLCPSVCPDRCRRAVTRCSWGARRAVVPGGCGWTSGHAACTPRCSSPSGHLCCRCASSWETLPWSRCAAGACLGALTGERNTPCHCCFGTGWEGACAVCPCPPRAPWHTCRTSFWLTVCPPVPWPGAPPSPPGAHDTLPTGDARAPVPTALAVTWRSPGRMLSGGRGAAGLSTSARRCGSWHTSWHTHRMAAATCPTCRAPSGCWMSRTWWPAGRACRTPAWHRWRAAPCWWAGSPASPRWR